MRTLTRALGRLGVLLIRLAHLWGGQHSYLSTSCLHRQHGYCESRKGSTTLAGTEETWTKKPSACKFCPASCVCGCHVTARHARPRQAAAPS